jgi:gamma-glutamyltranspeptidase / glutathione hydrolase
MKKNLTLAKTLMILCGALTISCSGQKSNCIISGSDIKTNHAMVVSAHPLASEIAAKVMADGGNAVDAAVATELALAVCYPAAGNIGGGGFMVIRLNNGTVASINYREKAPSAATRDMFLDNKGNVIDGLSLNTHLSSGVPGTVDGLLKVHARYGKLPFQRLIQPAIDIAARGFVLTKREALSLNEMRATFLSRNRGRVAFVREDPWQEGDTLKQPDLAKTLVRIRDLGRDGFYSGITAQLIVNECRDGNGIISSEDLKNYTSELEEPLKATYRNYEVITMPPPSSGGIALIQMLKMIEPFNIERMGFHSTESIHLMIEAERRAYADRAEFLGDPDMVSIPVSSLISNKYLLDRMADFNSGKASSSEEIKHGNPAAYESEETTHYSIVDQMGNAVAGTTTLNNGFGSGIVVNGAGFILNDEMDDFSIKPGYPNMFGLTGGDANAIQPCKRMLSSMTPTILLKDNKLKLVVGSPGGSTIITTVFQVIVNVTDFNMNVKNAVDAGRFHHQWQPDIVYYEKGRLDTTLFTSLKLMGHSFKPRDAMGRADAVFISDDGSLNAGSDERGEDNAAGF